MMSCQDVSVPTLCQDFFRLSGQRYILYPYILYYSINIYGR